MPVSRGLAETAASPAGLTLAGVSVRRLVPQPVLVGEEPRLHGPEEAVYLAVVVLPLVLLQNAVAMVAAAVLPPLLSPAYPAGESLPGVSV